MAKRDEPGKKMSPETAAKNRRLAILLALIALGFYVVFILMHID
ncbi:MAG TPA: hypothetical protein VLN56_02700 [Gammaproteobacteria bacterium]|nr:hypothetical protein [Gammaproteobacteria bacterium]